MIEAHNEEAALGIHSYELGMNHLGDMVSLRRFCMPEATLLLSYLNLFNARVHDISQIISQSITQLQTSDLSHVVCVIVERNHICL